MWEFEIENIHTGESMYIWGYSLANAFARDPDLKREEWRVVFREYID